MHVEHNGCSCSVDTIILKWHSRITPVSTGSFTFRFENVWDALHYNDVTMGTIASQITSLTIAYSAVNSDADQRKHQSSASLAFVRGIHRGPVNSTHKWSFTREMFPFDDVIMDWTTIAEWRPPLVHGTLPGCLVCYKCQSTINISRRIKSMIYNTALAIEGNDYSIPYHYGIFMPLVCFSVEILYLRPACVIDFVRILCEL